MNDKVKAKLDMLKEDLHNVGTALEVLEDTDGQFTYADTEDLEDAIYDMLGRLGQMQELMPEEA